MFGRNSAEDKTASKEETSTSLHPEEIEILLSWISNLESLNYSTELPVALSTQGDSLFRALNKLQNKSIEIFNGLKVDTIGMNKSAQQLNSMSKKVRDKISTIHNNTSSVADLTNEMNQNMQTVSAAAEELSINMHTIADAAKETEEGIHIVSSGTMELTSAAKEIASSTEMATSITQKAINEVDITNEKVTSLESAASEIGIVTTTISEISDQTKLLALNATIEAARAGEAGKGFAVVAKEVKELALQTNKATKDIQSKVEVIQQATEATTKAIHSIWGVINEVNEVVTTIAAASEEQSATTQHIADNIINSLEKIKDMTINVQHGASAVQDVNISLTSTASLSNQVDDAINSILQDSSTIKDASVSSYALSLETTGQSSLIKNITDSVKLPEGYTVTESSITPQLCRFTDYFSVKIAKFDDDHRQIFQYINTIHRLVKENSISGELLQTIKELANFTTHHFAREEEEMSTHNYPDYYSHKEIHQKLLATVSQTITQISNGEEVDLIEILIFLKEWLYSHIQSIDMRYSNFLIEKGVC